MHSSRRKPRPLHACPHLAKGQTRETLLPARSSCLSSHGGVIPHAVPSGTAVVPEGALTDSFPLAPRMTPRQRQIGQWLNEGARVLLDVRSRDCVIYTCRQGIRMLGRLSLRMLSSLVAAGALVLAAQEGQKVHFVPPGGNVAWFAPEVG